MVIDRRHPQVFGGVYLDHLLGAPLARDLDDEVEEVAVAAAVVHAGDEVRDVVALVAVDGVGDVEAQVIVLDVIDDLVHLLQRLRDLLLPGAGVADDEVDVALVLAGGPGGPGGVEVHVARGAYLVVRPEDGDQPLLAAFAGDDGAVDAVGGVVGVLHEE